MSRERIKKKEPSRLAMIIWGSQYCKSLQKIAIPNWLFYVLAGSLFTYLLTTILSI